MCGRYAFLEPGLIPFHFDIDDYIEVPKKYNVAPNMFMPVVVRNSPNRIEMMRWGLMPKWAKDHKYTMINARAETITEKPTYKKLVVSQRCIVPASGFFEWQKGEDKKTPYYITVKGEKLFGFAGLYDHAVDSEGKDYLTYTIITTSPNTLMEKIHDRMPVILAKEDEDAWLDKTTPLDEVLMLLKPYPASKMDAYPVSDLVNNSRNNVPEIVEKL